MVTCQDDRERGREFFRKKVYWVTGQWRSVLPEGGQGLRKDPVDGQQARGPGTIGGAISSAYKDQQDNIMFTERIQPRFSEMNPAGHIGFTVLPAWFEKAAEQVYRLFMPDMEPATWSIIVARFDMECLAEIHYREEVVITTRVKRIGNASFTIDQSLRQGDREAARAATTMVHFDYSTATSKPLSAEQREKLSRHQQED